MLTGDTVSTAVNIAMACNLIDSDMENDKRLFVFDKDMDSASKIRRAIDDANKQIQQARDKQSKGKGRGVEGEAAVDGPLFGLAMHGDVWKKMQRSRKRKKAEEKDDGDGGDEKAQKTSTDLFRQKMGERKKSKRNLLEGQQQGGSDDAEKPKASEKDSGKKKGSAKKKDGDGDKEEKKDKKSKADDRDDSSASSSSSGDSTLLDHFFTLCSSCQSVIACRLEPKEKADIVDQMRDRTGRVALAIGDGQQRTTHRIPPLVCADTLCSLDSYRSTLTLALLGCLVLVQVTMTR